MVWNKLCLLVFFMNTSKVKAEKLDLVNCGIDEGDTVEGAVLNHQYPFVGVLFYSLYGGLGETRSVTTVVLIHVEFVLANSADIGPMPKQSFRDKARVLLGEGWERGGRRVRNYVVHPEYDETINSVAIVHLRKPVANMDIKPICPPPERIRANRFWIIKFEDNLDTLKKVVLPAADVPAATCRDFYVERNLNEERRRPSFVKCAVSLNSRLPCVWGAGAVLASRDVWGRWQLLGFGVHGPGCGAPARFLHMLRYYPWIEESLDKFQRITISQINPHKYVLRSGIAIGSLMRFGDCDEYEKQNLIYRDGIVLNSDNSNVKTFKYNMTIFDSVQYTCLMVELLHATASAELSLRHFCPRGPGGTACYAYKEIARQHNSVLKTDKRSRKIFFTPRQIENRKTLKQDLKKRPDFEFHTHGTNLERNPSKKVLAKGVITSGYNEEDIKERYGMSPERAVPLRNSALVLIFSTTVVCK